MPGLNWSTFETLPGAADLNFEHLCRALVRRNYGRYGKFAARASQPGVEFHLELDTECSLGDVGRWYGWQCRWYDLPGGRAIGTARRNKITEALRTTERELPGLTDWVLWTRRPLTAGDQTWFYAQETDMRLHLWTADEVDEHASGPAEILRSTYFGDLILTPDALADLHTTSVAPVRRRWLPEAHQPVEAERELQLMLGSDRAWLSLPDLTHQLANQATTLGAEVEGLPDTLRTPFSGLMDAAGTVAKALANAYDALETGDLDLLRRQLATRPSDLDHDVRVLPRKLRSSRHRSALTATNVAADLRLARQILDDLDTCLGTRLIAVLADAGCGKTQLAAQITAPSPNRPAGIFLRGGDLHAGDSLNDLALGIVIQGSPVASMEALLAAVDAAGERVHRRLPVLIDGINEAEDPRDWAAPLTSLNEMLAQYPYVLVICTLRPDFAQEALPPDIDRLEIPDFEHDTREAVARYFEYYRIDRGDGELPWGLLRHPLTLRLFCEVTNPSREHEVTIEASAPGSLAAIFDRYLDQASDRIAELAPRTHRYYAQDVRRALDDIGICLWESRSRSINESDLRRRLGDDGRPWNESMVRALEQEGVVLRIPGNSVGEIEVAPAYDALGGHLIADAILRQHSGHDLGNWIRERSTEQSLAGSPQDRHPLANDTFRSLIGLVPRRLPPLQLWRLLDGQLRTTALRGAAELEGSYLDAETVEELAGLVVAGPDSRRNLLNRLYQTRGVPSHPLNSEFLDRVLRPMGVAERDALWTEWIRSNQTEIIGDLRRLEARWHTIGPRPRADQLRAHWVMWTLTSTVHAVRDQATRTLYWYGRGDPAALFKLTIDALGINDAYVPERLLAASLGVAMAHQLPDFEFAEALGKYLVELQENLTGTDPIHPTSHWLSRLHARSTFMLAWTFHPSAIPAELESPEHLVFVPGQQIEPIATDDTRHDDVYPTLHMDFENYTLGRLFNDRGNYDMSHVGHQAAVAHVLGAVWTLGWRKDKLGNVDGQLNSYSDHDVFGRTERYGKKYGWIGFYTLAGTLNDDQQLPRDKRLVDVQLDPSFPEPPRTAPIALPTWARPTPIPDPRWIRHGIVTVPDDLLCRYEIDQHPGPWIAVDASLVDADEITSRRVFGRLTAVLVEATDAQRLLNALDARSDPGRWFLPETPDDIYTFAGEIPWSSEFARGEPGDDRAEIYRETVAVGSDHNIEAEILAHRFSWEDLHSRLNTAGGALVPSRSFSKAFDLRGMPQSFDQTLPDGTRAAISLSAPPGFDGHLLYLREDLVRRYAEARELILFIWGRRQLHPATPLGREWPRWLQTASREHADVWREVRLGTELCRGLSPDS